MTSMKDCLICSDKLFNSRELPPCGCMICQSCLFDWFFTLNKDTLQIDKTFLSCPNLPCKKEIEIDWLKNLPLEKIRLLNDVFLKKYLNARTDILKCPKQGCEYAGFHDSDKICYEIIKCQICDMEWKKYDTLSIECGVTGKSYMERILDELSEIRVALTCKTCFSCNRFVNKSDGCKHITCVCKAEFCYICMNPWEFHLRDSCSQKEFVSIFPIFIFFWIFLSKIVLSFNFVFYCVKFTLWLFFIQLLGIFIISLNIFTIGVMFNGYNKKHYGCSLLFMLWMYCIYQMYYNYYFESLGYSLKLIYYEICLLLIIAIPYFVCKVCYQLFRSVLRI